VTSHTDATRQRLIRAAIRLFAAEGVDRVALRRINEAAGTKNTAAAHYHFGNRLGLFKAILAELDGRIAAVRDARIDAQLSRPPDALTPREAVAAAHAPYIALAADPQDGPALQRIVCQLVNHHDEAVRNLFAQRYKELFEKMLRLFRHAGTELSDTQLKLTVLWSARDVINGMTNLDWYSHTPFGRQDDLDPFTVYGHYLNYLSAPFGDAPRRLSDAEHDDLVQLVFTVNRLDGEPPLRRQLQRQQQRNRKKV